MTKFDALQPPTGPLHTTRQRTGGSQRLLHSTPLQPTDRAETRGTTPGSVWWSVALSSALLRQQQTLTRTANLCDQLLTQG